MIGVAVVGHNQIADGLLFACDFIIGHHRHCRSVCLTEGVSAFKEQLYETLDAMSQEYDELIVLTDIKGGTPFNLAFQYKLEKANDAMVLVTGVNLPIVMELVMGLESGRPAKDLTKEAVENGQPCIFNEETEEAEDDFEL